MMRSKVNRSRSCPQVALVLAVSLGICANAAEAEAGEPLVLQEMSWKQVQDYLKNSDMVIIPIGSTEQHGPHLPLGTDYFEALEISKRISAKTQVMVAPVVMAGYSAYHSGFPGTLSLKPETLQAVLLETAEMLIKYGFRRFMFFNYHGGNKAVETAVIHKINQTTTALALRIGIEAHFFKSGPQIAPFDYHAGVGETSIMLYLKPDLVDMSLAKKPRLTLSPELKHLEKLIKQHPDLDELMSKYLGTPAKTGKKGASHQLSNNGIWTRGDPKTANKALGRTIVDLRVDQVVAFIEAWKKHKKTGLKK